jgi:hypothetical protein
VNIFKKYVFKLFCEKNWMNIHTCRIPLLCRVTVMLCHHLAVLLVFFRTSEQESPLSRRPRNKAMPVVEKDSHIVNTTQYIKGKNSRLVYDSASLTVASLSWKPLL